MDLKGKIALVTGAGRGIGKATALALAKQGAHVIVTARTKSEIDSAASEIKKLGSKALAITADISQEEDVANMMKSAIGTFGTIDILINNAGIGYFHNVADLPVAEFDAMWQVNMRGLFLCTKAVLPYMIQQSSGDILNIASLAGRNAFVAGGGYCATKWALPQRPFSSPLTSSRMTDRSRTSPGRRSARASMMMPVVPEALSSAPFMIESGPATTPR